jgi:hypothetical protein
VSHVHREGGPTCDLPTRKACDERYADWQAAQQVRLAALIVARGDAKNFRKDSSVFGQLVQVMGGLRETITNQDGLPSEAPFTRRVMRMLEVYHSQAPSGVANTGGSE